jgi:hypothetical protein
MTGTAGNTVVSDDSPTTGQLPVSRDQ